MGNVHTKGEGEKVSPDSEYCRKSTEFPRPSVSAIPVILASPADLFADLHHREQLASSQTTQTE